VLIHDEHWLWEIPYENVRALIYDLRTNGDSVHFSNYGTKIDNGALCISCCQDPKILADMIEEYHNKTEVKL